MSAKRTIPLLCLAWWLAAVPALGQAPEFMTQTGSSVLNLDAPVSASTLQIGLIWYSPAYSKTGGAVNSLQCLATARNRGELKRGLNLTLEGEIFAGSDAETLKILTTKTRPFNPAARFSWDLPDYSPDEDALGFMLVGDFGGGQQVDFVKVDCRAINRIKCLANRQTLCAVGNNRFKVQLDYGSGQGQITLRSPRAAQFTVANPNTPEVVVELYDRCGMNDHFWVAVGSVTPVSFEVVVEDTLSGETRSFSNPGAGMVMVDAAAFPTCP